MKGVPLKKQQLTRKQLLNFDVQNKKKKKKKRKTTKKKTAAIICVLDGEQYKEISRPRAIKSLPPSPHKSSSQTL